MQSVVAYLRDRFIAELPLWRLRWWQLTLIASWAAWPWIAGWLFPGDTDIAFLPVIVFLPFAYLVGGIFAAAFPDFSHAYEFGVSFTVFLVAYLVIVSWRQRRAKKRDLNRPPHPTAFGRRLSGGVIRGAQSSRRLSDFSSTLGAYVDAQSQRQSRSGRGPHTLPNTGNA